MNAQPHEEFCPRCGTWVILLRELTGWCAECSSSGSYGAATKRAWRQRNRAHSLAYDAAYKRRRRREAAS